MAHYHAATPYDFVHMDAGDNGACRCEAHAGPNLPQADACRYPCYMCQRLRILQAREAQRGDPRPLPGEEKAFKAQQRALSLAAGGCGCGSYGPRALKAFAAAR